MTPAVTQVLLPNHPTKGPETSGTFSIISTKNLVRVVYDSQEELITKIYMKNQRGTIILSLSGSFTRLC